MTRSAFAKWKTVLPLAACALLLPLHAQDGATKKETAASAAGIEQEKGEETMRHAPPKWMENTVFYQIYPQSFQDSNGDGVGDLRGIIERLDYVKSLGVSAIWLNPIFDSPFHDAGYDVRDYFKIAERYGTEEDLRLLIKEAHARGLKVLLDLVAGHTSVESEWFRKSSELERNEFSGRYMWTNGWDDDQRGFRFIGGWPSGRNGFYMINFFYCQPALNYGFVDPAPGCSWQVPTNHPDALATREAMRDVMRHYLEMGCDGFRVDMASSLVRANDPKLRQQGLTELWQDYRTWMKRNWPEAVLVAEWFDPASAVAAGFDSDFFLTYPAYYSLLRYERARTNAAPIPGWKETRTSYFDISGKGDAETFLREMEKQLKRLKGKDGFFSLATGNHDIGRIRQGRTLEDLKTVYVFLFTLPGAPFLYYGDEIGMNYVQGLPNKEGAYCRSGSRTPMQWDDGINAGFSTAEKERLYLPIDPSSERPTVAAQDGDPSSLLNVVRRLIRLRKEIPALGARGQFEVLKKVGGGFPLVFRRSLGDSACVVAVNPSGKEVEATLTTDAELTPLLICGTCERRRDGTTLTLKLGAASSAVFRETPTP